MTAFGRALAVLALCWPPPAGAAPAPADRTEIARVEAYLDGLKSLRAKFVQTSTGGAFASGRIYVERPGRLRVDYDPPETVQLYADGGWLVHVDTELEEVSHIPLDSTPAGLLLGERVALAGETSVTRVERSPGRLHLHLVRSAEPDAGTLILAFDARPLRLREWTAVDAQGVRTLVVLLEAEYDVPIDRAVFHFDPDRFSDPAHDP